MRLGDADRHIPAHIHIDVFAPGHPEHRAQVVFSDDPLLKDPYWQQWATSLKQPFVAFEFGGEEIVAQVVVSIE